MTERLKSCPFCDGKAQVFIGMHHFNDVIIRCESCEAEGPLFDEEDADDEKAQRINGAAALLHWNMRIHGEAASK